VIFIGKGLERPGKNTWPVGETFLIAAVNERKTFEDF